MPSPEIQAYLEAMNNLHRANEAFAEAKANSEACFRAHIEAWMKVVPPTMRDSIQVPLGGREFIAWRDQFVWLPLLTEEIGGSTKAAEVAWALGQRPNGYQEASRYE